MSAETATTATAIVYLNDRRVGTLIVREQRTTFQYEDFSADRPVFGQAFEDEPARERSARIEVPACPPEDLDEYIRRLVSLVAMGNGDGHLKNWTIWYEQPRAPRLSPAYDLLSITSYGSYAADRLAFAIGGSRRFDEITPVTFDRLAGRAGLDTGRVKAVVAETVTRLQDTWPQIRAELPVPAFVAAHVTERLATLPLLRSR